jgi:hypothetical protein
MMSAANDRQTVGSLTFDGTGRFSGSPGTDAAAAAAATG